jgi:hypothetical protein
MWTLEWYKIVCFWEVQNEEFLDLYKTISSVKVVE